MTAEGQRSFWGDVGAWEGAKVHLNRPHRGINFVSVRHSPASVSIIRARDSRLRQTKEYLRTGPYPGVRLTKIRGGSALMRKSSVVA